MKVNTYTFFNECMQMQTLPTLLHKGMPPLISIFAMHGALVGFISPSKCWLIELLKRVSVLPLLIIFCNNDVGERIFLITHIDVAFL